MRSDGTPDRTWERKGAYALVCGNWTIGKYIINGSARYGLFEYSRLIGYFDSAELAKEKAK